MRAIILINVELGHEQDIVENVKQLEMCKKVMQVFGAYDMVVELEAKDSEKLRQVITNTVRKFKYVRSTITLMMIEN